MRAKTEELQEKNQKQRLIREQNIIRGFRADGGSFI